MTTADPNRPKRAKDPSARPPSALPPFIPPGQASRCPGRASAAGRFAACRESNAAGPCGCFADGALHAAARRAAVSGRGAVQPGASAMVAHPASASFPFSIQTAPAPKPVAPSATRPAIVIDPFGPKLATAPQAVPAIAPTGTDEDAEDVGEVAVKSAPPFLVSMLVHMVLVIVLALITFSRAISNQVQLSAVYAESLGQQLLDDKLQSPAAIDMQVESPALSFDLKPADDPLAAPPKLSDFFLDANKATSNLEAPSIGMALTGREPGMKKALLPAYGGNATTEATVLLAA